MLSIATVQTADMLLKPKLVAHLQPKRVSARSPAGKNSAVALRLHTTPTKRKALEELAGPSPSRRRPGSRLAQAGVPDTPGPDTAPASR